MTNLVAPHGSDILKPLIIKDKSEKDNIITQSKNLHQLKLNSAAAANAVMLAAGYFTPLEGYMNKKDALSVSENMVTTNGLFWPVPIINLTKEDITGVSVGDEIALLDPNVEGNPVLAIQRIETIEKISDEDLSLLVLTIVNIQVLKILLV